MRSIQVIFKSNTIETEINGTKEEIEHYYKSNYFNVGVFPIEKMEKAERVTFLD